MNQQGQVVFIYSPRGASARLQYVLDFIFKEHLACNYTVCTNISEWHHAQGIKINYSSEDIPDTLRIVPASILFEEGAQTQSLLHINRWKKTFILFYNQPGARIPFDIFSAIFFMLSRYEEYLPFNPDKHQRFAAHQSLAYQYSFLNQPVVDLWILHLSKLLSIPYQPQAKLEFTIDIDLIWKYKHKSPLRTLGGFAKDLLRFNITQLKERIAVLYQQQADPMDCFDWIQHLTPAPIRYFVLTGGSTAFDKNTRPDHPAFQTKIKNLAAQHPIHLHPSYSATQTEVLISEKNTLEQVIGRPIEASRQHFIKLHLPHTYRQLIEAGINSDYTMGYPDAHGFRAGTAHSFYWFDLLKNQPTTLRIYPFVYMDATSVFYLKQTPQEELREIEQLCIIITRTGGTFRGIWHNYLIGDAIQYPDRKNRYAQTVNLLTKYFVEK